jgi:hypothetical protein
VVSADAPSAHPPAVAALAGAAPVLARSASGGAQPDPTFGNGRGFVTTSIHGQTLVGYASVAIPGGDVVIAGQAFVANGNGQILVARYLPNGRLDPSFGTRGSVRSSFPVAKGPFIATAIVRQGSALVIGGGDGQGSMLALRLTASGRLDRTFGARQSGVVTVPSAESRRRSHCSRMERFCWADPTRTSMAARWSWHD